MIQLPKNPKDNAQRIENGVNNIMTYVCKQIDYMLKNNPDEDVVAIVKSGSDTGKGKRCGVKEEFFPQDLILQAMKEVKNQGYYTWYNINYMGNFSCWITLTNNQPHPWYSRL